MNLYFKLIGESMRKFWMTPLDGFTWNVPIVFVVFVVFDNFDQKAMPMSRQLQKVFNC
jgi:hypothetical protein